MPEGRIIYAFSEPTINVYFSHT